MHARTVSTVHEGIWLQARRFKLDKHVNLCSPSPHFMCALDLFVEEQNGHACMRERGRGVEREGGERGIEGEGRRDREREKERQTDRQTDRQIDRQTDRHE